MCWSASSPGEPKPSTARTPRLELEGRPQVGRRMGCRMSSRRRTPSASMAKAAMPLNELGQWLRGRAGRQPTAANASMMETAMSLRSWQASFDPREWICPLLAIDADAFNHAQSQSSRRSLPSRCTATTSATSCRRRLIASNPSTGGSQTATSTHVPGAGASRPPCSCDCQPGRLCSTGSSHRLHRGEGANPRGRTDLSNSPRHAGGGSAARGLRTFGSSRSSSGVEVGASGRCRSGVRRASLPLQMSRAPLPARGPGANCRSWPLGTRGHPKVAIAQRRGGAPRAPSGPDRCGRTVVPSSNRG
jgi:hypothetical protein